MQVWFSLVLFWILSICEYECSKTNRDIFQETTRTSNQKFYIRIVTKYFLFSGLIIIIVHEKNIYLLMFVFNYDRLRDLDGERDL